MTAFLGAFGHGLAQALLMAAGMLWQVGWSLVLGFLISGLLQTLVSKDKMVAAIGRDRFRDIAIATAAGAASSSCSYASAAVTRTMLQKGAALAPALAFSFASTNLVVELGLILLLLMGWQFMAAEWIGGLVLIAFLSVFVKLTYPTHIVADARRRLAAGGHRHEAAANEDLPLRDKLARRETWVAVAQNFVMDWSMLWKDLAIGFLVAGALTVFVPEGLWQALFVTGVNPWIQVPANALLGPVVAVITFVCSIGNVPMAAVLWGSGVGFGGVLAFLYADLIVLPLLNVYRRAYGWKMAAYIAGVFYATMVASAIVMDVIFSAFGWIPDRRPDMHAAMAHVSVNYTFWLNLVFGILALAMIVLSRRKGEGQAAPASCCAHHGHVHHSMGETK